MERNEVTQQLKNDNLVKYIGPFDEEQRQSYLRSAKIIVVRPIHGDSRLVRAAEEARKALEILGASERCQKIMRELRGAIDEAIGGASVADVSKLTLEK